MDTISPDALRVNLFVTIFRLIILTVAILFVAITPFAAVGFAPYQRTKRYLVPGTESDKHPKTAAIGYFDETPPELCTVRSRGGVRWGDNELAFNESVMEQAIADGFNHLRVLIHYKQKNITVNYRTTFDDLRKHGRRVLGVSGWEWSMDKCHWSIDGQPATGPAPEPAPQAEQAALFAFDEPQRVGGY